MVKEEAQAIMFVLISHRIWEEVKGTAGDDASARKKSQDRYPFRDTL